MQLRPKVVLALAAAAVLAATGCAGGGGKNSSEPRTTLPSGGVRKILRDGQTGVAVKAVVYGSSGEIDPAKFGTEPSPGNHLIAVKVGLRNTGTRVYSGNPAPTASITNEKGEVFRALDLTKRGLGSVRLRHGDIAYGRIFFELRDGTKARSFRFRPFGPKSTLAVFAIEHGKSDESSRSTKPLAAGGTQKILRAGRGMTIKAVVYGSSGAIPPERLAATPKVGTHFIAVKLGIRNLGTRLYAVDPTLSASITNNKDEVFDAFNSAQHGLGQLQLEPDETAYGRLFFEIRNDTKVRSFRFNPFGAKSKPAVFRIRHGKGKGELGAPSPTGSAKPLPAGGERRVVRGAPDLILKAVFYRSSGQEDTKFAVKPEPGTHLIAVTLGLRNTGSRPYRATPFLTASITNSRGEVSRALHSRLGLGRVDLEQDRGVYGRLFFRIRDHTKVRSFQFKPFGAKRALVFAVEHGKK